MTAPLRVLRFDRKAFGSATVCQGRHIAAVVAAIEAVRPGLVWHASDVRCVGEQLLESRGPLPLLVGTSSLLARKASGIEQFQSGVFVGTPSERKVPRFREGGLWTEDDEMAELGDAVVELRAFDTSYISVASSDEAVLNALEHAELQG